MKNAINIIVFTLHNSELTWYNQYMDFWEAVTVITMMSLIFGTINTFIKRRYAVLGQRSEGRHESSALVEIERLRQKERAESRALYERLVKEKLDVINTAVAMGHTHDELAQLDARLERLVGPDKLKQLLDSAPQVKLREIDLMDEDLEGEIQRLTRLRENPQ